MKKQFKVHDKEEFDLEFNQGNVYVNGVLIEENVTHMKIKTNNYCLGTDPKLEVYQKSESYVDTLSNKQLKYFAELPKKAANEAKCDCGGTKLNLPHSRWCSTKEER